MRLRGACLLALLAELGCGGTTRTEQSDAAPEGAPWDAGPIDDAGYTHCTTPEGFGICGSLTGCAVGSDRSGCQFCIGTCGDAGVFCGADAEVGVCSSTFDGLGSHICPMCDDESVCYTLLGGSGDAPNLLCTPLSLGTLLSPYVHDPDKLRYADLGAWTGQPLAAQATCPSPNGFQVCGGTCGTCAAGQHCVGRAPLHPFGFCIDDLSDWCKSDGSHKCTSPGNGPFGCFTFSVEPQAQAVANEYGICMPVAKCQAVASQLPGGGTCTPQ